LIRLIVIAVALLSACTTASSPEATTVVGSYQLSRIDRNDVKRIGMRLTLETGGTARFAYACSERFAQYNIEGDQISFSQVSTSTTSCTLEELTEVERKLSERRAKILYGTHRIIRTPERLSLSGLHKYEFTRAVKP
jgi:heat shock protein HslJ